MLHRLILKVTNFQLRPPKRLSTVVKIILLGNHAPPPPPPSCQTGSVETRLYEKKHKQQSVGYRLYTEGRLASENCIIDNARCTVFSL